MDGTSRSSRRKFLATAGTAAGTLMMVGIRHVGLAQELAPTPGCSKAGEPTPQQTAGPYFKPNSPPRSSLLEPGETATPLRVSGWVRTTYCKPVANALLEFWHANAEGEYDLKGFRYRGHVFSDTTGRFEVQTILPGRYGGRARHIHVRVQPAGGSILTTQLYFPDEPSNRADILFNPALLLNLPPNISPLAATFDFALKA
jgi:protocatechuate 3,4-dioxygenase beta subunit